MRTVVREKLVAKEVLIDGQTTYVNCTLVNCKIIYPGGDSPFVNTKIDNCEITFIGEANKTLQFMHSVGMIQQQPQITAPAAQLPGSGTLH